MSIQLNSIRNTMEEVAELSNRLNSLLPAREQLEPLTFVSLSGKDEIACHVHAPACRAIGYPCSGVSACQGRRESMEDAHVLFDCLGRRFAALDRSTHWAFYGVYDGHGGSECAKLTAKILHKTIMAQAAFEQQDYVEALRTGYLEADAKILATGELERWRDGATAVTALIVGKHLYVANVGDSELVLAKRSARDSAANAQSDTEYTAEVLSKIHKPSDSSEVERIERAGGNVFLGRVSGTLAVSRALGDSPFKTPLNRSALNFVSAEPFVQHVELTADNEFLILACDGLWDVFKYHEVIDYIAARRRIANLLPEEVAKELTHDAIYKRGSRDNVTVVVVYLSDTSVVSTSSSPSTASTSTPPATPIPTNDTTDTQPTTH
jgi:protein phosphatase PTC2/3